MFGSFLPVVLGMLAAAPLGLAHMEMSSPPPLGSTFNPNRNPGVEPDYDMKSPLNVPSPDAAPFPCRGHLNLLGTNAGKSVANWSPGSSQTFTITGSATHGGGSCQAMLSYDKGNSWTVIKSWIGNCVMDNAGPSSFTFTVPDDAPAGDVVFGWSWFNALGNREMYHNCAAVTIGGSSGSPAKRASVPFSSRPGPFIANVAQTDCKTLEGGDVVFPNPGPDVENSSTKPNQPVGNCGGSGGGNVPAPAPAPAPAESSSSAEASPTAPTVPTGGQNNNGAAPAESDSSAEDVPPTESPAAAAPTDDAAAPAGTSASRPPKGCRRYRKRTHGGKRAHPRRASF